MGRWRTYIAVACLLVAGILAAAALAGQGRAGQGKAGQGKAGRGNARSGEAGPGRAVDWASVAPLSDAARQRANRQAAERDAGRLLARIVLPSGATPSAGEPTGDAHGLSSPGAFPAATKHVDRHGWWTVVEPVVELQGFFRAHTPRGGRVTGYGSGGRPASASVTYSFPPVGRVLGIRYLVVSMVALPGGATGIRVDAEVQWIVPRPRAERIPPSVRVLDVSVGPPHAAASTRAIIVNRAKVERTASWINGLEITQPGAMSCPSWRADAPVVRFTFRRALAGAAVAQATQLASAVEPTTACDPMTLRIEGRRWPPLLGGAGVVHAAQRLLGVRLARP